MKRAKRVIPVLLAGLMVLGMAGCGKMNQGGEETNFPYSWKEEKRGTVLLRLDGSYGPEDYRWGIASTDESVLEVKVVKKEKKGVITYRIKPLKEGSAQIVFVRQREVADMEGTADEETTVDEVPEGSNGEQAGSDVEGDVTGQDGSEEVLQTEYEKMMAEELSEEENPEAAAEAAEGSMTVSQIFEEYRDRFRPKDVIGEIKIRFDAESTGRRGKLRLSLVVAEVLEHTGIMQNESEDGGIPYQVWEDSNGQLRVRLPMLQESWSASWEGEYEPQEDPGIPGIVISRPEMEDGRYVILEIQSEGYIEGAYCYTVQGLDQGTATLEFSNPEAESRLFIHVTISRDGEISVLSHGLEASGE